MYLWFTYQEDHVSGGGLLDPEDRWSSCEDAHYHWRLGEVSLTEDKNNIYRDTAKFGSIVDGAWVEAKTKKGDDVFVVTVRYESGDTFGRSFGHGAVACICKDLASAKILEEAIWKNKAREYLNYMPWVGCFENLTDVQIETRTLR
jgi:hypothetical protein